MKTLQLSTIVLLLASVFSSCTKDDASLSTTAKKTPSDPVVAGSENKPVLMPIMYLTADAKQTPITSVQANQSVTISYTAKDPVTGAAIDCGRVKIFQWVNNDWSELEVTGVSPTVTYTFTPTSTEACVYKFAASFVPGGGQGATACGGDYSGVGVDTQTPFCVSVTSACTVTDFGIKGKAVGIPVEGEDGMYEITVTYTISTPEAMENVHFQGGATSGGHFDFEFVEMSPGMQFKNENKQNKVMYWEGSLADCGTKTLFFKYKRRFSCPADANSAVSGQWTLTGGGLTEPYIVDPVTYDCVSRPSVQ